MSVLGRIMGRLARPILYRIDVMMARSLDERLPSLQAAVAASNHEYVASMRAELSASLATISRTVDESLQWQGEALLERNELLRHDIERIEIKVDALRQFLPGDLRDASWTKAHQLSAEAAAYLATSAGHTGPAAQAGVWFNPPVTLAYEVGNVRIGSVNERIAEIPYAIGTVSRCAAAGAAILDIGGCESLISLELASLGYDVTLVDMRASSLTHPNLRSIEARFEEWNPKQRFDVILLISTIEHFGLVSYDGSADADQSLDRRALEHAATLLNPVGRLVLTVPYGEWSVDEHQRVYDEAHLDALMDGWQIEDRRVMVQTADAIWVPDSDAVEVHSGARRVAMLTALRPPASA